MAKTPMKHTSLSAVTAAANGSSVTTRGIERITVELNYTGTPTTVSCVLEQRLGSGDWTQVGDAMTDAPGDADADFLYQFNAISGEIRLRLVTLTGGSSPTCTGVIERGGAA